MQPRVTARCLQPQLLTTCPMNYPKPPPRALGRAWCPWCSGDRMSQKVRIGGHIPYGSLH